jgi:ABC-type transporter Mla maintaining outer membrane lipid asymmetry permease subunit MlaE
MEPPSSAQCDVISEQIAAHSTLLATDPVKYLIVPRILAGYADAPASCWRLPMGTASYRRANIVGVKLLGINGSPLT